MGLQRNTGPSIAIADLTRLPEGAALNGGLTRTLAPMAERLERVPISGDPGRIFSGLTDWMQIVAILDDRRGAEGIDHFVTIHWQWSGSAVLIGIRFTLTSVGWGMGRRTPRTLTQSFLGHVRES